MLSDYLNRMRQIRQMGRATSETSYYTPLENMLDAVGSRLDPSVTVTSQLSRRGTAITPIGVSGVPDFGFFVVENQDLRGLIEAKGVDEDVSVIARQQQITKYLRVAPAVLITTYREFLLVTRDAQGRTQIGPFYSLAPDKNTFWETPVANLVRNHETRFREYLSQVLQYSGPIYSAEELALVLARYAAEALARVQAQTTRALNPLRTAMTEALGITFLGDKGEAFFRSSLVQTLFYGLFSAWIIWTEENENREAEFAWEQASDYLKVAVIGALFEAIATNRQLRTLNLSDPVRWAEDALNRVDRETFFADFSQEKAIQYFYEPFLDAYDPTLRKELGVWYTPPEIVKYQVKKIDTLLRTELGIRDGLADESVIVLDPCTGTSSYLLEAAKLIFERARARRRGTAAARTKAAVRNRLIGFEIMPAPFVIAHLQMARLLSSLGSGLGEGERAAIYLTNALKDWEVTEAARQITIPELQDEREAAEQVKRNQPILVIMGNPPYWRKAPLAIGEEAELLNAYKEGLYERFNIRRSTLDDLYIRFFRLGEWRIAEQGEQKGIVSFISNWNWLAGSSFPVMREHLLYNFDKIEIDGLGGAIRGRNRSLQQADENVFKTALSPGIILGISISFLIAKGEENEDIATTSYRRILGTADEKRQALLQSLEDNNEANPYSLLAPIIENKWVLKPTGEAGEYDNWISLEQLLPHKESGVNENRGNALISIDKEPLEELQALYLNTEITNEGLATRSERARLIMQTWAGYTPANTRAALMGEDNPEPLRIIPFAMKQFDDRWLLWGGSKILNRRRENLLNLVDPEDTPAQERNVFLATSENARNVYSSPGVTIYLGDLHFQDPWAQFFPLRYRTQAQGFIASITRPNLNQDILLTLCREWDIDPSDINVDATEEEMEIGSDLFYHILATTHTPAYISANEEALTTNWAKIPIPKSRELLKQSAALGKRVAELLRLDLQPEGVETGEIPRALELIGAPERIDGEQLRDNEDFEVTVNYRGVGRVVPRPFTDEEAEANKDGFEFGESTNNVFWNAECYWANVPNDVWNFLIGGFPVLRKWLEDRRRAKLGRNLTLDEIEQFSSMTRRITALLMLGAELDASHELIIDSDLIETE